MRLYVIRHGETPWNVVRRLQGQSDIALNDNGRALAEVTARALRNIPFDFAVTSPLSRAEETARLVLGDRTIPILTDARIREISFGVYEGELYKNENGQVLIPECDLFFKDTERYQAPEGGESVTQLRERTAQFLQELETKEEWMDKTILVSTHGAASRALLSYVTKCETRDFWGPGVPPNCAVTILDYNGQEWKIIEQDVVYYENSGFLF